MTISTTSISHVRLTVTDIERSRQFYEGVFGWPVLVELPPVPTPRPGKRWHSSTEG